MAEVKISQLLLFTPELEDEIIVNDVSQLVTKRSTLQDVRDLANQNIDDTGDGSQVTGNLTVTGTINGINLDDLVTEDELLALGLGGGNTLNCIADSAPTRSGADCGIRIYGETTIDSDLFWAGVAYGDGTGIFNIQFSEAADSADHARYAIISTYADLATSALRADSAAKAEWSIYSQNQQVKSAQDLNAQHYLHFSLLDTGIDSVHTDGDLQYNPGTNILSAQYFSGDGSLLTNVNVETTSADLLGPKQAVTNEPYQILFFPQSGVGGYDSVNIDANLFYNHVTNTIYDPNDQLFVDAQVRTARKVTAKGATGTNYLLMGEFLRGPVLGDSDSCAIATGLTWNQGTETLNAVNFDGDGSALTNVAAVTAITATNVTVTSVSDDAQYYMHIGSALSGGDGVNTTADLRYNPNDRTMLIDNAAATIKLGADSDVQISAANGVQYSFDITNNGSSAYRFQPTGTSVWFPSGPEDNPVLYLRRGDTYRFDIASLGHPLEIRVSNGGAAYSTGVTNNSIDDGYLYFSVPMSAPTTLYYQCTVHAAMGNTINIV